MTSWQVVRLLAGTFILLSLALGIPGSPLFMSQWWLEGRPGIVRNPQKKRLADCSKTKSHLADAKAGFHRPVLFN